MSIALIHLADILQINRAASLKVIDAAGETFNHINRLHLISPAPPLAVTSNRKRLSQGEYLPADRPVMAISVHAVYPHLTIAHEFAHFLDNRCLHANSRAYASEVSAEFAHLHQCWRSSVAVRELGKLLTRLRHSAQSGDRAHVRELLTPRELWARTYAQWVASRSTSPTLRQQLENRIPKTGRLSGKPYTTQWEHADSRDIMHAVDELLRSKGW